MSANRIPVNELGGPSLVALMAERLAVDPSARASAPPSRSATARGAATAEPARRYAPDLRTDEGRALLAWGLWLRGAIVGAAVVAMALALLVDGSTHPVYALLLGAAGGFVATYCWRRVRAAVGEPDSQAPAPERAAPSAEIPEAAATR